MENSGIVFDISRFCLHDGPGIRTTVFLKGCPLRCVWCHNPESQRLRPEIMFAAEKCLMCGACSNACSEGLHILDNGHIFLREKCTGCGKCVSACRAGALRLAGKLLTADEVMREVLRDRIFYEESGGGLTVSGGEPLAQSGFLLMLLTRAKAEGLHTCVETCGFAPLDTIKNIAPLVDTFLYDWKESNSEKHREFTGVDNGQILSNLEYLCESGVEVVLRLPLIPGYNATDSHIEGIISLANRLKKLKRIDIMPYHPLGTSKEKELGRNSDGRIEPEIPSKQMLDDIAEKLRNGTDIEVNICI